MLLTEITTRNIAGHWHMVVSDGGQEQTYPARSESEAAIMARMEKRRRGIPVA